jgi:hypothetical protein
MSTSFSTKISILAEVHAESLWNSELDDFKRINDIALPLCYLVENKFAMKLPTADNYIDSTWEMLCKLLDVDPNTKYDNADDILGKSPLFKKEEE